MSSTVALVLTGAEVALVLALSIRLLRKTKYAHAPRVAPPTASDHLLALLLGALLTGLCFYSPQLAFVACGGLSAFLWLVWLDVALYRSFSFELGLGGVRDVVLSNLVSEVIHMRCARQFLLSHRDFLLLPVLIPLSLLTLFLAPLSALRVVIEGSLLVFFAGTLFRREDHIEQTPSLSISKTRRALFHNFVRPRRPQIAANFVARPEHAALLSPQLLPQKQSPQHGLLSGRSVVLLTFESLGQTHLTEGAAKTPFLSSLAGCPHTLSSRLHVSLAPLTNVAHHALYFGQHTLRGTLPAVPHLGQLSQLGYQSIYLTAVNTAHYGLARILQQAGFDHICDGPQLLALQTGRNDQATDELLVSAGMTKLAQLLSARPFFLHVHAGNAHLPYHVDDQEKFHRHDMQDDRGRFLNAIEETDALFHTLWQSIEELVRRLSDATCPPLLILSSDHGQSFGEHFYQSHGSAVTAEQTLVPLLFHHPLLSAQTVAQSTHFDVIPTVLDLLGLPSKPSHGSSLLSDSRPAHHLLWDGQPSRNTSGCLGLLIGDSKYSLDLIRDTLIQSDWQDQNPRVLDGAERSYFESLIGLFAKQSGVL